MSNAIVKSKFRRRPSSSANATGGHPAPAMPVAAVLTAPAPSTVNNFINTSTSLGVHPPELYDRFVKYIREEKNTPLL